MGKELRVLIADDAEVVRERLSAKLAEISSVEVVGQARDTHEAMRLFDSLGPDAAIIDVQMPGGSGIDVLRHIKMCRPGVVVMMLTNFPYPHYRKASLEAGADYFMDKSEDLTELMRIVQGLT